MKPGWLNENSNRSYPFVHGTVDQRSGPTTLRRLPDGVVADCGFIMGVDSGAEADTRVSLRSITRTGDTFVFLFAADAEALDGSYLEFTRDVSDPDFAVEHVDSTETHAGSWSEEDCDEQLWSGFLVTGKMSALDEFLPSDGTVSADDGDAVVEPACVQSLAGSWVKMVGVANADRVRAEPAEGCGDAVWPFETGLVRVRARCLQGEIVFLPGYNCSVRQDQASRTLVLSASVGAGEGEPCGEVSLFDEEQPPEGGTLLDGSQGCGEVLRSFSGAGGRLFNIVAGTGVTTTVVPGDARVIVSADFAGMASCETEDGSVVSVSEAG